MVRRPAWRTRSTNTGLMVEQRDMTLDGRVMSDALAPRPLVCLQEAGHPQGLWPK